MKKIALISTAILLGFNALFAQDGWLNNVMGGFKNTSNSQTAGLHVFNSKLYTATGSDSGCVFRTSTGQRNSWKKVFKKPGATSVKAINSTSGNIYISAYFGYDNSTTTNHDSTVIFRSMDGSTNWTPYFQFLGNANFIIPFKGTGINDSIYIVRNTYNAAMGGNASEIWKAANDSNHPVNAANSWKKTLNLPGNGIITSTCIHNNALYVGTNNGASGYPDIWSSFDGNIWTKDTTTVFNMANSISAMVSYGGYLFVGTENYNVGAQIWKTVDGINWSLVGQYPPNPKVTSLQVNSNELWATLEGQYMQMSNTGNAKIIRNVSSQPYNYSMANGFGIPGQKGTNGSTLKFGNNIYYACDYFYMGYHQTGGDVENGSQIWKLCLSTPPTINLGPDITVCAGVEHTFDAGTGASGYVWWDESTNQTMVALDAQNYNVTVMGANGCESTDTVALKNISSPTISGSFHELPPLCKGDTLDPINVSASSNLRVTLPDFHGALINPLPIPDYQTSYDTLMVSGIAHDDNVGNTLISVTIDSLIRFNNWDLTLKLIAPNGSILILTSSANGQNFIGTKFTKAAANLIYDGMAPYTGSFTPEYPFSDLSGPTNGAWILQIINNAQGISGVLKGWSLTFSQIDTNVTFSLAPATGLSSTTASPILVYPATSTVYTITATNGTNSCKSYDSIRVQVPGIKINPHAAHICKGQSDSLSAEIIGLSQSAQTSQLAFHWSNNAGLIDSIAPGINVTPNSSIIYFVMDTVSNAHCIVRDTTSVIVDPDLFITASSNPPTICFGNTDTLTGLASGGTAPYTYLWDDGNTTSTDQPYIASPTYDSYYTLTLTDAWGCSVNGFTNVMVTPSTDIYGHVDSAGGSFFDGEVVIYKYLPYQTHFDTVQKVSIDNNGDYYFAGINYGSYLIKIFPNTTLHPTAMPTYFGNQFLWTAATVINHNCDVNNTANISVIFPQVTPTGSGEIGGIIQEGLGFVRQEGDPIPGVDVKLGRNPGGQIIASTQTDDNGYYYFGNLALNSVVGGSYTVYTDIPGVGMASSYTVALDPVHPSYDSLNYVVDSTTIDTVAHSFTTGINNYAGDATTHFTIYPNPCKGNTVIEYSTSIEADVTLVVVNVLGVKVKSLVNSKQSAGNHRCNLNNQSNPLSPGLYFITLTIDGESGTQRIVVID